jgi:hypothetical protein
MQFVKSKFLLLFVIHILMNACSYKPEPVIILEPVASETSWLFGQEFAKQNIDDIEISTAFYRTIEDVYIFDIEITNQSGKSILISPESFYYINKTDLSSSIVFAKNPENELTQIDNSISNENNSYNNEVFSDAVFSLLNFAVTIATIGDETDDEILNDVDEFENMQENMDMRDDNHVATLNKLNQKRDEWEISILRKTSLESNSFMQGRVYFPVSEKSSLLKITFPIEGKSFDFQFKSIIKDTY